MATRDARFDSPDGAWRLVIEAVDGWKTAVARARLVSRRADGTEVQAWSRRLPHGYGPRDALVTAGGQTLLVDEWINVRSRQALVLIGVDGQTLATHDHAAIVAASDADAAAVSRHARRGIEPFVENQTSKGVISYGVSSYGYDMRLADEFKIFKGSTDLVVDPKNFNPDVLTEHKGDFCIIPPNSFVLGKSLEYFRIPRNIITICLGKSTYARCGIIVNVTPFEPEWEGYVTMEISNTSPTPAKIYAREGIAQVIFLESDEPCQISYADKKGKYQKQTDTTYAKI